MSLGLKYTSDTKDDGESFFIVFDAIQSYTKTIKGQVTRHPIAGGKLITTNYTRDNPTFGFTGIISVADISNLMENVRDEDGQGPNNNNGQPGEVLVNESTSTLTNLIPASISQFLPDSNASVSLATDLIRTNYKDFVAQILERLMSGEKYDESTKRIKTFIRPIKLYEFMGSSIDKVIDNVVLTSYTVKEEVDTGDCLICDLEFEQVKFVSLRTSALPADVVGALKKKSTAKQNKGAVNSKKTTVLDADAENKDDTDKLRKAVETGGNR